MDFVVEAGGLMETVASGIPKTWRLFLISYISQEPNWESTAQEERILVTLIGRSGHQAVWKANSNPSTTMPGQSFQADLSVYRADIKLHFVQRMFPQGIF